MDVEQNLVANNTTSGGAGAPVTSTSRPTTVAPATFEYNTVVNNTASYPAPIADNGTTIDVYGNPTMEDNNFIDVGNAYEMAFGNPSGGTNLDATNSYWGTTHPVGHSLAPVRLLPCAAGPGQVSTSCRSRTSRSPARPAVRAWAPVRRRRRPIRPRARRPIRPPTRPPTRRPIRRATARAQRRRQPTRPRTRQRHADRYVYGHRYAQRYRDGHAHGHQHSTHVGRHHQR